MKKVLFTILLISSIFLISDNVFAEARSFISIEANFSNSSVGSQSPGVTNDGFGSYVDFVIGYSNLTNLWDIGEQLRVEANWCTSDISIENTYSNFQIIGSADLSVTQSKFEVGKPNTCFYTNPTTGDVWVGTPLHVSFDVIIESEYVGHSTVRLNFTNSRQYWISFKDYTYMYLDIAQGIDNTNSIINNQNQMQQNIISGANQNKQEIIDNQDKNNQEIKDAIDDSFKTCHDSRNLLNIPYTEKNKLYVTAQNNDYYVMSDYFLELEANTPYTFSVETSGSFGVGNNYQTEVYLFNPEHGYYQNTQNKNGSVFSVPYSGKYYVRYDVNFNGELHAFWNFQIVKGSTNISYEPFGEKICTNKIDETNDLLNGVINGANQNKQDIIDNQNKNTQDIIDNANKNHEEAENTRKGIFGTLKSVLESIINLPTKLVTLLIEALTNLLKSLFIPGDDFLNNWFNDLKGGFEKQLGFLSYPITWIIEILNKFLTLNDTGHYIISWGAIKVPNFDFNIIESGSFDLASLLQDSTIKSFHDMYLIIIDALMLLGFMNLCLNVYNRIIGGEVDNYEYISVDEGYNIDVETGEVTSQWTRQRRTRKEKVV